MAEQHLQEIPFNHLNILRRREKEGSKTKTETLALSKPFTRQRAKERRETDREKSERRKDRLNLTSER